jgi:hypothetical protein
VIALLGPGALSLDAMLVKRLGWQKAHLDVAT